MRTVLTKGEWYACTALRCNVKYLGKSQAKGRSARVRRFYKTRRHEDVSVPANSLRPPMRGNR